MKSFATIKI